MRKNFMSFSFPNHGHRGTNGYVQLRKLGIPSSYAWHGEEIEKI